MPDVNWLAILLCGISSMVLGAIWYSPLLFAKRWMAGAKLSEADLAGANMGLIYGTAFLLSLIAAAVFAMFLGRGMPLGPAVAIGRVGGHLLGRRLVRHILSVRASRDRPLADQRRLSRHPVHFVRPDPRADAMSGLLLALALAATAPPPAAPALRPSSSRCVSWSAIAGAATGQGGPDDVHCFERVFGGQHVRDRHEVSRPGGPIYRGETLYSWDGGGEAGRLYLLELARAGSAAARWSGAGQARFRRRDLHRPGRAQDRHLDACGGRSAIDTYEAVTTSAADPTGRRVVRYTRID